MESFLNFLNIIADYLPTIGLIMAGCFVTGLVVSLGLKLYNYLRLLKQEYALLELTPPAFTDRLPEATSQLFAALHGLGSARLWRERILQRRTVFSLEIASTRAAGIRFLLRVPVDKVAIVEQAVTAYIPEAKVRRTDEFLQMSDDKPQKILEFQQAAHFAYPLKDFRELESHDPIAYLTNAMTKLKPDELMVFQVLITPLRVRKAESLSSKILSNEDLLPMLDGDKTKPVRWIFGLINKLLFGLADGFRNGIYGSSKAEYQSAQRDVEYRKQAAKHLRPVRTLSYFEHELVESIHVKLAQPLFQATIRAYVTSEDKAELLARRKGIETALSLFAVPKWQNIKVKRQKYGILRRYLNYAFLKRIPSIWNSNLLAASEVAGLYHFPNSLSAKTENVVKSLSRTLPAPVPLKDGTKLDILLGENQHHGTITPIGLTAPERERHVYIIGGTGNGKTTMLLYGIVQDIRNGQGVAVLDPHGDLAETILGYIPEERVKDVIYLNPDDLTHPIGINLLELELGLSGDELLREKDLITESTISVLRKIFSEDDSGGHRIEYILRNAIQTALTLENPTLFTIFRLLNDTKFRQKVVRELEDDDLKIFWKNEIAKAGEMQKVKMAAGITSKIGRFLFSASARRILEQEKSTINFEEILASGKILICNFSKGLIGEDTSTLFGTTVLAKLQVAALKRARIKQAERQPFYLYVDEFQNFATMSFVQMLSEARKYKLFLTMAEQSTQQQEYQRLVDIILANVGTVICFRSGSPADERLVLPLLMPYIQQGELANLPAFNFYMRLAAVDAKEPLSGVTALLPNQPDPERAQAVTEYSRQTYGKLIEVEPKQKLKAKKETVEKSKEPKQASQARPTAADQFAVTK